MKIREKFENVQLQFLNLLKSVIYLLIDMIENETVSKFSDMHQKMTVIKIVVMIIKYSQYRLSYARHYNPLMIRNHS